MSNNFEDARRRLQSKIRLTDDATIHLIQRTVDDAVAKAIRTGGNEKDANYSSDDEGSASSSSEEDSSVGTVQRRHVSAAVGKALLVVPRGIIRRWKMEEAVYKTVSAVLRRAPPTTIPSTKRQKLDPRPKRKPN